ncbi:MAG: response regulator [Bacteroidota bacterium]
MKAAVSTSKYPTVMIIDDNEIDNLINQKMMEGCGFADNVYINTGSKSALEFLSNLAMTYQNMPAELIPKIIFLDINMPILDGFQFLEAFARLDADFRKGIRVVMLTVSTNPQEEKMAKSDPVVEAFMTKPLTEAMLATL